MILLIEGFFLLIENVPYFLYFKSKLNSMLSKNIQTALNEQVKIEAQSSQIYLAMASWAEVQPGIDNITQFFYRHSDEERMHMMKLIHFINERGGMAVIPALEKPNQEFKSIKAAFKALYEHEVYVSNSINELVDLSLAEKDYATHNFLQWYVSEQIEEEALARTLNDKLELIGDEKSGLYLFDQDILSVSVASNQNNGQ